MVYPALFLLLWLYCALPRLPRRDCSPFLGRDYAHRGLWDASVPENSLLAFRRAAEAGYGIEMDVHLTADDALAVIHDPTLLRMCGVPGDIRRMKREAWASLPLGGTAQTIPTLEEALAAIGGRVPVILEIKSGPRLPALCRRVAQAIAAYEGPLCVESFDPRVLRRFRRIAPQVLRGQLIFGPRHPGKRWAGLALSSLVPNLLSRPDFIAPEASTLSPRSPALLLTRALGVPLVAWTLRTPREAARCRPWCAAQIFEGYRPGR